MFIKIIHIDDSAFLLLAFQVTFLLSTHLAQFAEVSTLHLLTTHPIIGYPPIFRILLPPLQLHGISAFL